MMENVETLNHYKVQKIVTACPHCYHSLKNEYKQFGGHFEVYHHTELIDEMISSGKLSLKQDGKYEVTYHDSCYLGRYNDVYEAPRKSLDAVEGINLHEMKRSKDRGFCCGAGGGRMFLEDDEGGRINEERTKEAIATGADTIASACPFCMTMMTDGVKHFEKTEEVKVKDIAEIILENSN
jgi:Fe-S oxidoreductase